MSTPFFVDFRNHTTIEHLANSLGIASELLRWVTESPTREEFYRRLELPKKHRRRASERRIVWAVDSSFLAAAHQNFSRRFHDFVVNVLPGFPHPCAHGYVRKRSTLTNAQAHCGAPVLLRADIRSFFPSIKRPRLVALFTRLRLHAQIVSTLSTFVTIRDELPLGLHGSPLLANLVCLDLDNKLQALGKTYGCVYTRYADDLAFSGTDNVPSRIEVSDILAGEGFELSSTKFRVTKRGQAHFVTGLSISDAIRPRVPKQLKRRIRQELFYCDKYGIQEHLSTGGESGVPNGVNRIDGTLRYLHGIERELGQRWRREWRRMLNRDLLEPSYAPRRERVPRRLLFFIDEAEIDSLEGKVLALALVAVEAAQEFSSELEGFRADHLADFFSSGRKEKIEKKGLHFADLHQEVRTDLVRFLAGVPFRGFVSYDFIGNPSNCQATYESLLRDLLLHRMIRYDRCLLDIRWEENSKVKAARVESIVRETYRNLEVRNSRRPLSIPQVTRVAKSTEPYLAVPDTLLGVFAQYAKLALTDEKETAITRFERLRDKYRLIISVPTRTYFTRHNPFKP